MDTKEFWSGEFGDEYLKRNQIDWWARMPFWAGVISETTPGMVVEYGANCGWNLLAIRALRFNCAMAGVELNAKACSRASAAGLCMMNTDIISSSFGPCDLAFTAGVLIHIAPEDLEITMRFIADSSKRYVLAVEYSADKEEEVAYRGHSGKLWRRPYGKLYQELGLELVKEWPAGEGFDNCTAWLLRKPS